MATTAGLYGIGPTLVVVGWGEIVFLLRAFCSLGNLFFIMLLTQVSMIGTVVAVFNPLSACPYVVGKCMFSISKIIVSRYLTGHTICESANSYIPSTTWLEPFDSSSRALMGLLKVGEFEFNGD